MIKCIQQKRCCRVGSPFEPTRSVPATSTAENMRGAGNRVGKLRMPTLRELGYKRHPIYATAFRYLDIDVAMQKAAVQK